MITVQTWDWIGPKPLEAKNIPAMEIRDDMNIIGLTHEILVGLPTLGGPFPTRQQVVVR